ncbi:CRISPR-associated protein Cas4 [Tuberibacillus calidus]|jgi:CRISPR-associated exonuclease Cas4|uniref:CRISPR-associated protein Cas4 n=1 Tax=Tuberibacillus calidus TaxID=340097 RepID=UPI00041D4C4D|nr:CRISPR-associated protein Cas4 [Tuberibacillus calidus]
MISGLHVQYYFICHRKLWLYSKNLGFEAEDEKVIDGSLLHDRAYKNADRKELLIDQSFKIDVIDGDYVREVKLSSKMTEADKYQLLFYLYQLKKRGLNKKGLVSYTKEKRTEEVILTDADERKLDEIEKAINEILQSEKIPKRLKKPYCRQCAYYDFCYISEGGDT